MAEKKNFIIENYNGTDYDTLYPETNSGQVLLDSDAQTSTGLESGKTLDDALKIVGNLNNFDNRFEVGDVLTTSRTNLSNKWALCNGDEMISESYQELSNQFTSGLLNYRQNTKNISANIARCRLACRKRNGTKECLFTWLPVNGSSWSGRYSTLGSDADWVAATGISESYAVFARNNVFFRGGNHSMEWCTEDPTNSSSWHTMTKTATVKGYANDIFHKNEKYYFLMDDTFFIYSSLDGTPQEINIETVTGRKLSSANVGIDGDNFLFWTNTTGSGTNTYWVDTFNQNGQLVNSKELTSKFTGVIYSFSNGYIKLSQSGSIEYPILDVERLSAVDGDGTAIAHIAFPQSKYLLNFQHDIIVNNEYVVLPNNTYLDSEFNAHNTTSSAGDIALAICSNDDFICVASNPSQASVWDSSAKSSFYLPVYSPADGLRAYIKTTD